MLPTLVTPFVYALLLWVVVEDLRRFRVSNLAIVLLVAALPADLFLRGRLAVFAPHLLFAAIGFAVLIGLFALRTIGGGDAKLLAAALLWVGPEGCAVFAVALLASTIFYIGGASIGWLPKRRVGQQTLIPFGPSIATAWLVFIGLPWFLPLRTGPFA